MQYSEHQVEFATALQRAVVDQAKFYSVIETIKFFLMQLSSFAFSLYIALIFFHCICFHFVRYSRDRDRVRESLRAEFNTSNIVFNPKMPAGYYRLDMSLEVERQVCFPFLLMVLHDLCCIHSASWSCFVKVADYLRFMEMTQIKENIVYVKLNDKPFSLFTCADIVFRDGSSDLNSTLR